MISLASFIHPSVLSLILLSISRDLSSLLGVCVCGVFFLLLLLPPPSSSLCTLRVQKSLRRTREDTQTQSTSQSYTYHYLSYCQSQAQYFDSSQSLVVIILSKVTPHTTHLTNTKRMRDREEKSHLEISPRSSSFADDRWCQGELGHPQTHECLCDLLKISSTSPFLKEMNEGDRRRTTYDDDG